MPKGSGRRPLPTALKKLRGNPGKRKLNEKEPQPHLGEPEMPPGLSKLAKQAWRSVVPELLRMGVLSKIDGMALGAACMSYSRWIEAEREIDRLGSIIEEPILNCEGDEIGAKVKRNPAVSIANDAKRIMRSYFVEFGLTPSALSRLHIEKPPEDDPLDDFLKGKTPAQGKHVN